VSPAGHRAGGVLLAVLTLLLTAGAPASAAPAEPSVVVVGVAGLHWDDVDSERTPTLARLASRGSVGALSVRSAPPVTCPAEGWLTLGAGNYAAVADPRVTSAGCGDREIPTVEKRHGGAVLPTFSLQRRLNEALRFGARPGLLGSAAGCVSAVGPGAALAGADDAGTVTAYEPRLPADPGRALTRCPLTLVDLGAVAERGRDRALERIDDDLARVAAGRSPGSVLIVVGVAETRATASRLHVVVATGPGYDGGWVHAPSTRRVPYAQLADVAPTVLAILGREAPGPVAGRPWSGGVTGRPATWAAARDVLVDADRAATAQRQFVTPFFVVLGLVLLACVIAAVAVFRRGSARARQLAASGCALVAALPATTFLVDLVPWWRAPGGVPGAAVALTACAAVGLALFSVLVVWAYRRGGPVTALAVLSGVTFGVIAADLLTGARLQLDSLMGYNPVVAGRFAGIGNVAFAVLGVAALFFAAALAAGRKRWAALGIVATVAAVTVVADGSPAFGADLGGVLTLVPSFAVLALSVARIPITPVRVGLAALAGVGVVAFLGVTDFLRPVAERSHIGGFVAEVLGGGGGDALRRKLLANVETLLTGPHTLAVFVAAVVLAVMAIRPPRRLAAAYAQMPPLRPALLSVVALGAVGFATNDSGVVIPTTVGVVALPIALAACLLIKPEADDTPVSEAAGAVQVLP
jgi:hypothetical protein